ncbi:MAG: sugar ABC transporter permease [Chloroflexi bacterium]|nr:sugar ABC transporter permease [Chloroflexota bacterium]
MSTTIARRGELAEQLPFAERFARWRRRHRQPIEAWLILSPILLYYSIFFIFPVVANLLVSFTRWTGVYDSPVWVGLGNYKAYLSPPYPITLFNTILFTVCILSLQTTIAFFIAILLNEKVIGRGVYRALWYIPTLTSAAITSQVFFAFISPYDGVINAVLKILGQQPVIWTMKAGWMRTFVILYSVWRGVGTPVVLFLAALQGIHPEIYEAAMVDGADYWRLLRYITVPLLRPMVIFILITGTIAGFQIFETVMLITAGGQANVASSGGPHNMTNVMLLQIYKDAFVNLNLGRAAAGSVIMALLLLWFTTTNMRIMSRGQVER